MLPNNHSEHGRRSPGGEGECFFNRKLYRLYSFCAVPRCDRAMRDVGSSLGSFLRPSAAVALPTATVLAHPTSRWLLQPRQPQGLLPPPPPLPFPMDDFTDMEPPEVSFWGMVVKPGKVSKTTIPEGVQLHVSAVRFES